MSLLEISNLNLSFGEAHILKDINLQIERGSTIGLVGESGSGKSMTSLAAIGLLPKSAEVTGNIRFDGKDLTALSEDEMCRIRGRDIAMIFQEPMTALNPVKTIGEQIAEGLQFHLHISKSEAEERVLKLLDRVGLPAARYSPNRFPHELSGGQRQRVVIAIAIALNPKLLIADEPTTALDVTTQAKILDLLREINSENGSSLMLITHDLAVVAEMVDHVAVMKNGEIVERNDTLNLFRNMQHDYTKQLMRASTLKQKHEFNHVDGAEPLMVVDELVRQYRLPKKSIFGKREFLNAVDHVTFNIRQGENLGLVGESGCGKSTLARTLLALNKPSSGRLEFLGTDLPNLSKKELRKIRRNMQVVFQDPYGSFNPRHKVFRLVSEPLQLFEHISSDEKYKKVVKALEDVGLTAEDADKYPHEFSGGQRQRIAIARAIVTEPKLIIADEPVSALDVSIREQILDIINQLNREKGISYLFISHDLHVVRAVTDRVLIMHQGKIVEQGDTAQIFDHPSHEYTQKLLSATPNLEAALKAREAALV